MLAYSIRVDTSVKAADKAVAASISAKLTTDSINRGLTTAGLPPAMLEVSDTVLEVVAESTVAENSSTVVEVSEGSARQTPVPGAQGTKPVPGEQGTFVLGIIGGVVGAVLVMVFVGGACLFQRRTCQPAAPNVTDVASVELGLSSSLSTIADGACLC